MVGDVLQIVGLCLVVVGAALLAPWLGFVAGGVALVVIGLMFELEYDDDGAAE